MQAKMKFYDINPLLNEGAQYSIAIGERSNGKTYAALKYGIEQYLKGKGTLAVLRRWDEDLRGKRGQAMFNGLIQNGEIAKLTDGKYESVYYNSRRWYFCKYDGETRVTAPEPFAYAFALSQMEHDKSTSYDCTTIVFDEFLTRGAYLTNEFVIFCNVLSTIIRYRENVRIIMLANTVNQFSPYFAEMGLTNVQKMKQGTIDVYNYGTSGLRVAVEYCDNLNKKGKPSDVYFAFQNEQLSMITKGVWELELYPHCPIKYKPKDIIFTYFLIYQDHTLQCEIVSVPNMIFTYIHRKTTPLQDNRKDHIYTLEYNPQINYHRNIRKPVTVLEKKITRFFISDKVFYQDNEIGEIVRMYLQECGQ